MELVKAEQPNELGALPIASAVQCDASDNKDKRRYEFLTRMLFSMLVDADRLDSERFEQNTVAGVLGGGMSFPCNRGCFSNDCRRRGDRRPPAARTMT